MKFSEIKHKIKNLGNFKSLKEIKKASLRIMRNTKTGDYWLIEKEFLKPVIKSPRECKSILIKPEDLKYKVLMVHKSKEELKGKKVLDYIKWGEKQGYHKRPTCKSRVKWYDLGKRKDALLILPAKIGEKYGIFYNPNRYVEDKVIYGIPSLKEDTIKPLFIILNSFITRLSVEINTRQLTGAQAISDVDVNVWENIIIPKIGLVNNVNQKLIEKFLLRPTKSIFTELGFDPLKPIREQEPNPLPDRKVLDDIVFDALGLTKEERKEVYWAVAELVKNRLEKAKSV